MTSPGLVHPPETLEGWYALHQIFSVIPESANDVSLPRVDSTQVSALIGEGEEGWSAVARLIGLGLNNVTLSSAVSDTVPSLVARKQPKPRPPG